MSRPDRRDAKKTEKLEIRVSYSTKEKLRAKARRDGRSVSATLRSLIEGYLRESEVAQQAGALHTIRTRPRVLIGALTGIAALVGAQLTTASAQDVSLEMSGAFYIHDCEFTVQEASDCEVIRKSTKFDTMLELEYDKPVALKFGKDNQYSLSVTVHEGVANTHQIKLNILKSDGVEDQLIATPEMIALDGESARISLQSNNDKPSYEITLNPKRLE